MYPESCQKLLPRTPVIIELTPMTHDPSVFKGGKFLPDVMSYTLEYMEDFGAIFGYTDFSICSLLLVDYPGWDKFKFRDPQEISSIAASHASISSKKLEVPFSAKSFNLPKDEVINYFVWRQMTLAGKLLKLDDAKTDPDSVNNFLEFGPLSVKKGWEGSWWRGRACNRFQAPAVNISTGHAVWFWDIDLETPVFSSNREYITSMVYIPN